MKAIIHIGHHKTGTTSLQSFLAVNWKRLLENGILSPWVEFQGAAWAAAQLVRADEVEPDFLPANIREPHNALAFRMLATANPERKVPAHHAKLPALPQMLHAISSQLASLEPEAAIFVSEVMSHFGLDAPELIDHFAHVLSGADFGLHVTLRRPDDQIVAWYGQQLWFGMPVSTLSDPSGQDPFQGAHFDYRGVIEPWLERLPNVTPQIRAHADMMAAGGSIPDFFTQSGLTLPDAAIDVAAMNPSLPRAFFPLMQKVNANVPRPAARTLGHDLAAIADRLDLPAPGDIEFFGDERRAELAARFAPVDGWLTGVLGKPLFDDIHAIGTPRPVSEAEALDHVLAALTEADIASFTNPDVRDYVTTLKAGL
ncbi:hypothetical protein [Sinisalibacter aestuarii]|uniref:Sulfotransferase family protein n=1 Tax=Sinisalibacter aestuarii TaxID=2949426 RepID=A0ABQ5LNJ3_9RHOB|nr:hypothetical protein [Sinisalibacter aestuarii]GKY86550.1 hypothetical protein STA1M1_04190 [Sinisalibacter aestuarii]